MSKTVTLPTGITVPKVGVWLYESCPAANEHDPMPRDFNPGSGLSRTHTQRKHAVCGLWTQWVRKPASKPIRPVPA